MFPFFSLTVTLVKRMEFKGKVVGEVGVVAMKIERYCLSDGSENDGEVVGLIGEGVRGEDMTGVTNGGNSTSEDSEGTDTSRAEGFWDRGIETIVD